MADSTKHTDKFPLVEELQAQLLPAFLQDRRTWVTFKDHVLPGYFRVEGRGRVLMVLKAFFDKYNQFPTLAQVRDMVTRKGLGDDAIAEAEAAYSAPSLQPQEIEYLFDECSGFVKRSKIKDAILESVDLLDSEDYAGIEDRIRAAANWNVDVDLGTSIDEVAKRFEALRSLLTGVVPSPWTALNAAIGGGFYRKELTIFAAGSSVGKSIALDNCATWAWRKGINTVVITLELSEARKAQRMDAELNGIAISDVAGSEDRVAKFFQSHKSKARLYIKEFPTSSVSVREVRAYLQKLELYEGFIPEFIVVDALDILNPDKKVHDAYVDQGRTGENLRALAQEYGVPLVTATQFQRASLNVPIDEINEGFLADSYVKMRIADTIVAIANTVEERAAGRINFKTIKARNGVKDMIFPLRVIYEQLVIKDLGKK